MDEAVTKKHNLHKSIFHFFVCLVCVIIMAAPPFFYGIQNWDEHGRFLLFNCAPLIFFFLSLVLMNVDFKISEYGSDRPRKWGTLEMILLVILIPSYIFLYFSGLGLYLFAFFVNFVYAFGCLTILLINFIVLCHLGHRKAAGK